MSEKSKTQQVVKEEKKPVPVIKIIGTKYLGKRK